MSVFSIDAHDGGSIEHALLGLDVQEKLVKIAAYRALNKTARWLKTQTIRHISGETGLTQKLIRKRMHMLHANRRNLRAMLTSCNQHIPASELGRMRESGKGARAGKFYFEGGFVGHMPSTGKTSIYRRKQKARLPIRELGFYYGGFTSRAWEDVSKGDEVMQRFGRFLEHELNFISRKHN